MGFYQTVGKFAKYSFLVGALYFLGCAAKKAVVKQQEPRTGLEQVVKKEEPVKEEIVLPESTIESLEKLLPKIDSTKRIDMILLKLEKAEPKKYNLFSKIKKEAVKKIDVKGVYNKGDIMFIYSIIGDVIENNAPKLDATHKAVLYRAIAEELNFPICLVDIYGKIFLQWGKDAIKKDNQDRLHKDLRDTSKTTDITLNPENREFVSEGYLDSIPGLFKSENQRDDVVLLLNYVHGQIAKKGNLALKDGLSGEAESHFRKLTDRVDDCKKALEINPKYVEGYNNLAFTLVKKAELENKPFLFKEALKACEIGLTLNPKHKALQKNMDYIQRELKK